MADLDGEILDRLEKAEFDGAALSAVIGVLFKHCVPDPDERRRLEHDMERAMQNPPVHGLPSPHTLNHRVSELINIIRST